MEIRNNESFKNITSESKFKALVVLNELVNTVPTESAKESFNRKPFYMTMKEEKLYGVN